MVNRPFPAGEAFMKKARPDMKTTFTAALQFRDMALKVFAVPVH
jgi:hypothetical protein